MNTLLLSLLIIALVGLTAVATFYLTVYGVVNYLTGDFWDELAGKKKR